MPLPRDHQTILAWLREQKGVDYVTTISHGDVILVMTRSEKLVEGLTKRGATARWYDRTEFSTKAGKSKADFQCEVLLGPRFFATEETAA